MPHTTYDETPLTLGVIEELKTKGYNQTEISEMFGVTRQAVSWHRVEYGGRLNTRQIVNKAWPWKTTTAHSKCKPFQRLRDHGEYMATGGKGMNEDKLQRLRSWWKYLETSDVVLEFDPEIPPTPGVCPRSGGFAYRKRRKSDGNLLIRVNQHTDLTQQGEMIWCWPPNHKKRM